MFVHNQKKTLKLLPLRRQKINGKCRRKIFEKAAEELECLRAGNIPFPPPCFQNIGEKDENKQYWGMENTEQASKFTRGRHLS
jgi:hypothetical protein